MTSPVCCDVTVATTSPPEAQVPPDEPRLRRDAEANRRQILRAAGRLMAERGLSAPLEDIAAEAGVGIGTLYRRFPTRADLVDAVFADHLAVYVEALEEALAAEDGWAGLLWFLEAATTHQIENRALNELLEYNLGEAAVTQVQERVTPLVDALVERAKATGRLRPDFALSDLAFMQQMLVALGRATESVGDRVWKRYMAIMVDGLLAARTGPTPTGRAALSIEELRILHESRPPVPWRRRADPPER